MTHNSMRRALILGFGYSGKYLREALIARAFDVITTRRASEVGSIAFDLGQRETWSSLPEADFCFWMFPCEPKNLVESFLRENVSKWGRVVCVGTTSSYLIDSEDSVVIEGSSLDLKDPRVLGEQVALGMGAMVVRSAGIYGPNRDPRRWVLDGRVGPSSKYVNFIHVQDLVQILMAAAQAGRQGATYLAADGRPQRWDRLIEGWQKEFDLNLPSVCAQSRRSSKQIDSRASLAELGVTLLFPDVQSGVRKLP